MLGSAKICMRWVAAFRAVGLPVGLLVVAVSTVVAAPHDTEGRQRREIIPNAQGTVRTDPGRGALRNNPGASFGEMSIVVAQFPAGHISVNGPCISNSGLVTRFHPPHFVGNDPGTGIANHLGGGTHADGLRSSGSGDGPRMRLDGGSHSIVSADPSHGSQFLRGSGSVAGGALVRRAPRMAAYPWVSVGPSDDGRAQAQGGVTLRFH